MNPGPLFLLFSLFLLARGSTIADNSLLELFSSDVTSSNPSVSGSSNNVGNSASIALIYH